MISMIFFLLYSLINSRINLNAYNIGDSLITDGIKFTLIDNTNTTIQNPCAAMHLEEDKEDIIIPEIVYDDEQQEFCTVVSIGQDFSSDFIISGKLTIPDSVVTIDSRAFEGQKITSLKMSANIKKIDSYAFSSCSELSGIITLSNTLEYIGKYCFMDCNKITKILNVDGVIELDVRALSGCSSLKEISLISLQFARDYSIERCTSLYSLTLSDLKQGGAYALSGCSSLERINGELLNLTFVGSFCFANCVKLYKLPFTNFVNFSDYVFYGCTGLNQ